MPLEIIFMNAAMPRQGECFAPTVAAAHAGARVQEVKNCNFAPNNLVFSRIQSADTA